MELIYTVNGLQNPQAEALRDDSVCCISSRNIIAFSSTLETEEVKFDEAVIIPDSNKRKSYLSSR